jgi:hypothetical protein
MVLQDFEVFVGLHRVTRLDGEGEEVLSVLFVEELLLVFEEHDLVETLSEEVFVEPAVDVFGVCFVEDLNELVDLQLLQNLVYFVVRVIAVGDYFAQNFTLEIVTNNARGLEEKNAFDGQLLLFRVATESGILQEAVDVPESSLQDALRHRHFAEVLKHHCNGEHLGLDHCSVSIDLNVVGDEEVEEELQTDERVALTLLGDQVDDLLVYRCELPLQTILLGQKLPPFLGILRVEFCIFKVHDGGLLSGLFDVRGEIERSQFK